MFFGNQTECILKVLHSHLNVEDLLTGQWSISVKKHIGQDQSELLKTDFAINKPSSVFWDNISHEFHCINRRKTDFILRGRDHFF